MSSHAPPKPPPLVPSVHRDLPESTAQAAKGPIGPRSVVVLAGRRSAADPLAEVAHAAHRALLEIEGEPMLVRVTRRLLAWPSVERILINIDTPELLDSIPPLAEARDDGRIRILKSTPSPSRSVLESLDAAGLDDGPVLVTTADHALLDDQMLDAFFTPSFAGDADLCFGLVSRQAIEARFPASKRTYLRFRDDAYSGANLFLFRSPESQRAAEFWFRVENDRKQPWRIAKAFGLASLLLFATRRLTLEAAMARVSRVIGARVEAIVLPMAEAAVDVDKIEDLELVREILAARRNV